MACGECHGGFANENNAGTISQWGEVKKKTVDRSRSKVKDASNNATDAGTGSIRGTRGRGGFEGRGRGRGDRARGGRGGRAGFANGTRTVSAAAPAAESTGAWDTNATAAAATTTEAVGGWDAAESTPATTEGAWGTKKEATNGNAWETTESAPAASTGAWETAETTTPAVKETPSNGDAPTTEEPKSSVIPTGSKKGWASLFAKPTPPPAPKKVVPPPAPVPEEPKPVEEPVPEPEVAAPEPVAEEVPEPVEVAPEAPLSEGDATTLTPTKDELTETNLEQLPDESHPPATATAASTVASTQDPHSTLNSVVGAPRPPISGYAATAFKATATPTRSASFQRRVLEQQEAVVMPGNHAVDRAAVQFGSMGLNGTPDEDLDDDREEAETRAQPPQHSPVAPRASLPPAPAQQAEPVQVARPAPGLPPAPQQPSPSQAAQNDFYYGHPSKPYDPFSQQPSQHPSQEPFANQAPAQPAVTSAASEYSPFYSADQQRNAYNSFYSYGQSQEPVSAPHRAASGFGMSGAETPSQTAPAQQSSRYGQVDATNSGHSTPNPTAQQAQPSQHMPQAGAHAGYAYGSQYPYYNQQPGYPYMNQMNHQYGRSNRPMFDDARRYEDQQAQQQQQQQQQYLHHNNQFSYGNQYAPYGKGGMYGQPQQSYGYDQHSTPAAFPGRDAGYGRTGTTQPETQASTSSSAFGMPDVFGRSTSSFGQQASSIGQQQTGGEESKSYEASKTGGPSPSLARPDSAANNSTSGQQQQVPPQGQQSFGGYPSQFNNQYGGFGGLGGQQAGQNHHQANAYGQYGANAGFSSYYGNTGRGGWGGNYGH